MLLFSVTSAEASPLPPRIGEPFHPPGGFVSDCYFHYSHLLPRKPGILPLDAEVTKQCRRCGILFTTKSRIRKRCEPCQAIADQEHQAKANARLKARRAAKRAMVLSRAS